MSGEIKKLVLLYESSAGPRNIHARLGHGGGTVCASDLKVKARCFQVQLEREF